MWAVQQAGCCSCSQLCCIVPRPKCLPPLFVLMLWPIQTRQSFGLTKPPVSHMRVFFFFPMNVKIFQAERLVHSSFLLLLFSFFLFLTCSQWRNYNILKLHSHIHIVRLMDSERGWKIGPADSNAVSELLVWCPCPS